MKSFRSVGVIALAALAALLVSACQTPNSTGLAYDALWSGPATAQVDECMDAVPGTWVLRATTADARGSYDIDLLY